MTSVFLHRGCNITVKLQKVLCGIKFFQLTILNTEKSIGKKGVFQIVIIFVDRKFVVNVGDAPLRVPLNFVLRVPQNSRMGGTHMGASPTKDCQHEMKHTKKSIEN